MKKEDIKNMLSLFRFAEKYVTFHVNLDVGCMQHLDEKEKLSAKLGLFYERIFELICGEE